LPKVTIDGKTYDAPEGANVLEVCKAHGVLVEHFCYHRYLQVDGNCRTCMVEIEGPRGRTLTISCNTVVTEGMVVHTISPAATKARKTALEFLLLDHPLDCPVCDKAGECSLQDNYMQYGLYDARRAVPRHFKGGKAVDIGEHIVLDQERCIECRRCIRFLDTVPQTSELCIVGRGHEATLSLFPGKRLNNAYSGCVTDVCPVGALTLKEFRFQQRVWFFKKTESVCDGCARGCSITMEHNFGRVWRYMPRENPSINRVWMCDEGRLSFKRHRENRLEKARRRNQETPWLEAFEDAVRLLAPLERGSVAGFASPWASLEDNWMMKRLFEKRFDLRDLSAPALGGMGTCDDILRLSEKSPNSVGLKCLGLSTDPVSILKGVESGRIQALVMMENDPLDWGGEAFQKAVAKVPLSILLASHQTAGIRAVSLSLPVRTYAEKDGTFVNAAGFLQRFRRAVEPSDPSVPSSALLLSVLAGRLGVDGLEFKDEASVFDAMARDLPVLSGLTFDSIPLFGQKLGIHTTCPAPFKKIQVDPNVVPPEGLPGGRL
jgi:NADH-quinone oxidoreductase subunit G